MDAVGQDTDHGEREIKGYEGHQLALAMRLGELVAVDLAHPLPSALDNQRKQDQAQKCDAEEKQGEVRGTQMAHRSL
jgi:hypothetical protein